MQSVPLYSNYKVVLTAEVFNDADSKKPASNTDAGDYIIYTIAEIPTEFISKSR